MERPALACECRIYIYNLALKLGMPIKGIGLAEGIEIFPKHDELRKGELGNAIRGSRDAHGAQRKLLQMRQLREHKRMLLLNIA